MMFISKLVFPSPKMQKNKKKGAVAMARLTKYLSPDLEELSSDPQQSWKENWLWPCAFPGLGESHRDGGFLESLTGKPVSPRFSKRPCLKR